MGRLPLWCVFPFYFIYLFNCGEMHFSFTLDRWEFWLLPELLFTLVKGKQFSEFTV